MLPEVHDCKELEVYKEKKRSEWKERFADSGLEKPENLIEEELKKKKIFKPKQAFFERIINYINRLSL